MAVDYVRTDPLGIYRGDDRPFTWPLLDAEGDPLDTTGWSARAQVRASAASEDVLHEWSTSNGRAVLAAGSVSLLVDDSESWEWSKGRYDLQLIDPSGHVQVIAAGRVKVEGGITR